MQKSINKKEWDASVLAVASLIFKSGKSRENTRRAVHKLIKTQKMPVNLGLADAAVRYFWKSRAEMPELYYERIRAVLPRFESDKNKVYGEIVQKNKLENLSAVLGSGIFYYCTEHPDCASDHAEYQGKIYVSRFWKERADGEEQRKRIATYIIRYGIREAEWVTNEPVWMVKRPNCRHRLFRLDTESVLAGARPSSVRFTTEKIEMPGRYDFRKSMLDALVKMYPEVERLQKDAYRAEILRKKWARN